MNSARKAARTIKSSFLILAGLVIAIAILAVPLQHYFSIGRFQHYGLALFVVGLGYLLQAIWSWASLRKWARAGHLSVGLFLASVAMSFYANPWLETRFALRTEAQEQMRSLFVVAFTVMAIPVTVCCLMWILDELEGSTGKKLKKKKR